MKRTAFAALLFSALLGGHALADTGPTNPNPTTPGMGSGVPPEIPAPGSTDPRMQGSDPGRQGGATTDGTDRSKRPETLMDGTGSERGTERNGTGSGVGGSGTGGSGTGSSPGAGTGMGGEGGSMGGSGTGSSGTGTGAGSGGAQ
ncbi:hypothetical protein ACX3YG_12605 [Pseudomonas wadenswilerensis]